MQGLQAQQMLLWEWQPMHETGPLTETQTHPFVFNISQFLSTGSELLKRLQITPHACGLSSCYLQPQLWSWYWDQWACFFKAGLTDREWGL